MSPIFLVACCRALVSILSSPHSRGMCAARCCCHRCCGGCMLHMLSCAHMLRVMRGCWVVLFAWGMQECGWTRRQGEERKKERSSGGKSVTQQTSINCHRHGVWQSADRDVLESGTPAWPCARRCEPCSPGCLAVRHATTVMAAQHHRRWRHWCMMRRRRCGHARCHRMASGGCRRERVASSRCGTPPAVPVCARCHPTLRMAARM